MNFYNKYILPKLINFAMTKKELDGLRPAVAEKAEGVVLEIGFGSGLNLPYYKNISKLYALDPSSGLYEFAKIKIKKFSFPIEYLKASAEQIPLAGNSIDAVVSTWSLCSIPHPETALKEIFRVLKPGGRFIFIEHGQSPENLIAKIQKLLTPASKLIAGGCHLDRKIDALITMAGFEIKTFDKFKLKAKPLYFMYRGLAVAQKLIR